MLCCCVVLLCCVLLLCCCCCCCCVVVVVCVSAVAVLVAAVQFMDKVVVPVGAMTMVALLGSTMDTCSAICTIFYMKG